MVKESILFVTATSLLIYFVMPAEQPAEVEAAPEEIPAPVIQTKQPSNDGWGYAESDSDEEAFIFGEPVATADSEYEAKTSSSEENTSSGSSENETAGYSANSRPDIPAHKIYY